MQKIPKLILKMLVNTHVRSKNLGIQIKEIYFCMLAFFNYIYLILVFFLSLKYHLLFKSLSLNISFTYKTLNVQVPKRVITLRR